MPRRKAVPEAVPAEWPRTVVIDGSRIEADLVQIDGKEFVRLTTLDGASTEFPVSSLKAVRPNIHKAVFDA